MEKMRLPFLGPGWFAQARAAGAEKEGEHWYLPANAVLPAGLRAEIERRSARPTGQSDEKRHKVTENVTPARSDTVPHDPELAELIEGMPVDEHRSAVIAEYYGARIAEIKLRPRPGPLEWARKALANPDADPYVRDLARAALQ